MGLAKLANPPTRESPIIAADSSACNSSFFIFFLHNLSRCSSATNAFQKRPHEHALGTQRSFFLEIFRLPCDPVLVTVGYYWLPLPVLTVPDTDVLSPSTIFTWIMPDVPIQRSHFPPRPSPCCLPHWPWHANRIPRIKRLTILSSCKSPASLRWGMSLTGTGFWEERFWILSPGGCQRRRALS